MKHLCGSIFVALFLTTAFAEAEPVTPQDRYDESVGHAYGYTYSIFKMGEQCKQLFPEFTQAIDEGLTKWEARNGPALAEIRAQWQAYVERDHKAANLTVEVYEKKVNEMATIEIKRSFETLGGEQSFWARAHCQNYAPVTLRSTKLYLESRLMDDLESFRQCRKNGLCPNLDRRR